MNRNGFSTLTAAGIGWLALAMLVILYATWKTTSGLESVMDIRFYDESYYLTQGIFHPVSSWIADYSPLYALYYKCLSQFNLSDPIALYYANYRVWSFVLPALVFCVLRMSGCSWTFSLIWAIFSSCAQINLPLWPKAGHLAMLGVAIILAGFHRLKTEPIQASLWIAGVSLCISWCRPEFLAGSVLALLFCAYHVAKKSSSFQIRIHWFLIVPLAFAVLFYFFWGFPLGESGRGSVAFGQHFVHNWRNISGNTSGDPIEDWVNWREIYFTVFGSSENVIQAMVSNPLALFKHLWFNGRYLIYNSFIYFFESGFPVRWLGLSVPVCLTVVWMAAEYFHGFDGLASVWNRAKTWFRSYGLLFFLMAVPSLLAGFLFQPRPHYILPLFPLFLYGVGKMASAYTFPQIVEHWKFGIGAGVVVAQLFFLPDAGAFFELKKESVQMDTQPDRKEHFGKLTTKNLNQKNLILLLNKRDWPSNTRIFDMSTGATEYLGSQVVQCGKMGFEMNYPVLEDFEGFLKKEKVNYIFLRSTINYDHFFRNNAYWQRLRSHPEWEGWRKEAVSEWGDSLLVKKGVE